MDHRDTFRATLDQLNQYNQEIIELRLTGVTTGELPVWLLERRTELEERVRDLSLKLCEGPALRVSRHTAGALSAWSRTTIKLSELCGDALPYC